jgi:serine/threonine-protein kinase
VVETGLLVSALLAIGGFIVYWLYPPSAGYLYHQAELLMASNRRSDWITAREEYLEQLDSRFPNHPYREQSQKWRDKIMLDEAEGRATVLSSPAKLSKINQPANNTESLFVVTFDSASAASERGDDLRAKQHWEAMAQKLKPDDPEQRPWYLLALQRVKERDVVMRDRRRIVETQLDEARTARLGGRILEANTIENKMFEQYGHFTDLADLFPRQPQVTRTPETIHAAPSGSPSQPTEEGKTPGAGTRHQADSPQDAGASDRRSPPSSPDDEPRPKPATNEPKAEDGSVLDQTPSSDSSNTSPPNSVLND